MLEFFKEIIIRIIHNYQSAFNERKYWKRRLYVQGGQFRVIILYG